MNDKELLELAAKAAEVEVKWCDATEAFWTTDGYDSFTPLTYDADALRLAVTLLFEIDISNGCVAVRHSSGIKILEAFNQDPYAATRRAIVRAAAEIGRSTEPKSDFKTQMNDNWAGLI